MNEEDLNVLEPFSPFDESDLIWMQSCLYDVESEECDFDLDCFLNSCVDQVGGVTTRSQTKTADTRPVETENERREVAQEGMRITKVAQKKNLKFNMKSSTYTVEIVEKETEDVQQAIVQVVKNIDDILNTVLEDADGEDLVFFRLISERLVDDIVMPLMPVADLSITRIQDKIEKVAQSNKEFLLKGRFRVEVTLVIDPQSRGSGSVEDWLASKMSDPCTLFFGGKYNVHHHPNMSIGGALTVYMMYFHSSWVFTAIDQVPFRRGRGIEEELCFFELCLTHSVCKDEESYEVWGHVLQTETGRRLVVLEIVPDNILDNVVYVQPNREGEETCEYVFVAYVKTGDFKGYFTGKTLNAFTASRLFVGFCESCKCLYGRTECDMKRKRDFKRRLERHLCERSKHNKALKENEEIWAKVQQSVQTKGGRIFRDPGLFFVNKQSVLRNLGRDGLCCATAIVQAMQYAQKEKSLGLKELTERAMDLHCLAGVEEGPCERDELDTFQAALVEHYGKYMIHVVYFSMGNQVGYRGDTTLFSCKEDILHLYLYHEDHHYYCITSIKGFYVKARYCEMCDSSTCHDDHKCKKICMDCRRKATKCPFTSKSCNILHTCDQCGCTFRSSDCFASHFEPTQIVPRRKKDDGDSDLESDEEDENEGEREEGERDANRERYSICQRYKRCPKCFKRVDLLIKRSQTGRVWRTLDMHTCGEKWCRMCSEMVGADHLCYIQPIPRPENPPYKFRFCIFDSECYAFEPGEPHEVELVKALHLCNTCKDLSLTSPCPEDGMGKRMKTFYNVNDFMGWLISPRHINTHCYSHNFRSYDGQFCLKWLLEHGRTPEVVMNGGKIMYMSLPLLSITFKDTLNFIPTSLAKMSSMFDLDVSKDYFPHQFNTKNNKGYVGPMPDKQCYNPDFMSVKERTDFEAWYEAHRDDEFDLEKVEELYCERDVEVLTLAMLKYREVAVQKCYIDPLTECSTLASFVMKNYMQNHMMPESIGSVPTGKDSHVIYEFHDVSHGKGGVHKIGKTS